jgi:conjugative coupling factor TraD (TOL family)
MTKYPIENLFRPAFEFRAAAMAIAICACFLIWPKYFWVSNILAATCIASCLLMAAWRIHQGLQIKRFHWNLRSLPRYELTSEQIPVSQSELFLGMGFWWTRVHTQRLFQARTPQNEHLSARNRQYERARRFARAHPEHWLTKWLNKDHRWNPVAPLPKVGGDPAIHGIEPDEEEMYADLGERVGHAVVLGTTRVGKTRFAEVLITQDIHRGDVVIVFDPKGDAELLKRMYAEAKRAGREKEFSFFHLGYPEISDLYNPVGNVGRITEVATRISNPIPGEGNSAAFKQFVWLYVNIIAKAATALGMNPTYKLIYQYAANLDSLAELYFAAWLDKTQPGWEEDMGGIPDKTMQNRIQQTGRSVRVIEFLDLIGRKNWTDSIADGLVSVLSNSKSKYQALVNSLFPLLEKLTTGAVGDLLSPNMQDIFALRSKKILDWDKVMDTGGIVYFGLDSLSDAEVGAAVGNAAFADLTSAAGRRYKFGGAYGQSQPLPLSQLKKVSIHADEFNELIGPEFVPLLNKAGGAGYQVTVYTQTWDDVEAKIGDKAKAGQIGGNLNTLYMLRVKNTETAEILTEQLPMTEIYSTTMVSGSGDANDPSDFSDFTAKSEDRITAREVPMIQAADLVQLPKGQAFALLEGGRLAKLRLPLPAQNYTDIHWPSGMPEVFASMQAKYSRYIQSVDPTAENDDISGQGDHSVTDFDSVKSNHQAGYRLPGDFEGGERIGLTVQGAQAETRGDTHGQ